MKKQFLTVFLASLVIFGLFYMIAGNSLFSDKPVVATDPNELNEEPTDVEEPNSTKDKNEIVFLMMGVDAKDVSKSKGTRTDTMMLTKLNIETGKITVLSIPRDTRTLVNGRMDKINAAHAYGGTEETIKAVRHLLDLDLEYYVKVDYQIVQDLVNAIGGVKVTVPFNMVYSDPTSDPPLNINIKRGEQTLDGKNAHDFIRYRHNNDMTVGYPDGDIGRIRTQQYFLKELVKQTITPKNLLKLPRIIETYFDNVETNIPITFMLRAAISANKIDVESMETATIPGEGQYVGGVSYFIHNEEETDTLIEEMFGDYLLNQ